MFEGLFQPMHLIILLIMQLMVAGWLFLGFQVLRRPGSKLKYKGYLFFPMIASMLRVPSC